jgi:hypothetical protein
MPSAGCSCANYAPIRLALCLYTRNLMLRHKYKIEECNKFALRKCGTPGCTYIKGMLSSGQEIKSANEWSGGKGRGRGGRDGGNTRAPCFTYCSGMIVAASHLTMRPSVLLSFAIGRSFATPFIREVW